MGLFKFALAGFMALAIPAAADDRLPWFDGEGQTPFQVTEDGNVVFSARELSEETEEVAGCTIESCFIEQGSVNVQNASRVSP
jgi:hypothetical protein